MPTLDSVNQDALFVMFKGEPGTRKSTQALSFPLPQYWISTDRKMDALKLPARKWGIDMKKVSYDDFTEFAKIKHKLEQLQVNCPFKTVILDSITSEGDVINIGTKKAKSGTKRQDGSEKGAVIGGISVNSIEDYKAEASAFQDIIALTKDIKEFHKVNVILIAHVIAARKNDEKTAVTHFARVIVTGGQVISAKIPAYCSEVYHFNIEQNFDVDQEGKYALYTVHTGHDFARTSLPLDRKIIFNDEPLYEKWIKPAIALNNQAPPTKF